MTIETSITIYITSLTFELEGVFGSQILYTGTSSTAAFRTIREFDGEKHMNSMLTESASKLHRGYISEDDGDSETGPGTIYQQTEYYKYPEDERGFSADGGTILFQITKSQVKI